LFFSTGLTVFYSVRLRYLTGMGVAVSHGTGDNANFVIVRGMLGLTGASMRWLLFSCPSVVVLPLPLKMGALFVSGIGAWVGVLLGDSRLGNNQVVFGATYFFLTVK